MGILGVILGVLAFILALIATLVFGWMGGVAAIVVGAIAVVLGLQARKKNGKGRGAVVSGAISCVLAIVMVFSTASMMKTMKEKLLAEVNKEGSRFATVAKYVEQADTNTGFVGFVASMAGKVSDEDKDAFEEEVKNLSDLIKENSGSQNSTPATEAPAAEPAG